MSWDGEETDLLQLNLSDLPLMLRNAVVALADEVAALRSAVRALEAR